MYFKTLLTFCIAGVLLAGCALNPLSHTEITTSFADRAVEVNEAYSAELNAQILKNILRARDRQARTYTSLSDLKLTPTASGTNKLSASGLGLGNNVGDPWINLGGERTVNHSANLELTISAKGRGEDGQSVYHNPISPNQFNYYFRSEWSKDLVSELLVEDLALAIQADKTLLDALQRNAANFRVLARKGRLTYCFEADDCGLDRSGSAQVKARAGQNMTADYVDPDLPVAASADWSLSELDEQGGFLMTCRQEATGVKFDAQNNGRPQEHNLFRCSNQPLSAAFCAKPGENGSCEDTQTVPVSLFYVTRWENGSPKNGVFRINASSIDNIIYNIGKSLRPAAGRAAPCRSEGAAFCTHKTVSFSKSHSDPVNNQVPLFSVATSDSLSGRAVSRCHETFQARVKHHGQTYYAGPPQKFYPGHEEPCYFLDRSGTTLTLLSEIIKLNQVNTELVASTVFFRN